MHSTTRRMLTEEWWERERTHFEVWVSARTEYELADGTYRGQEKAIAEVRKLRYLPLIAAARTIALRLIETKVIPQNEAGDAQHLGTAIAHQMYYLITWNYAHLVNPAMELKLRTVAKSEGWRVPMLVSPESIPWATLGKNIRRK